MLSMLKSYDGLMQCNSQVAQAFLAVGVKIIISPIPPPAV